MSIPRKVRSIEIIFRDLEQKVEKFRRVTHLPCVVGCGFCCKKSGSDKRHHAQPGIFPGSDFRSAVTVSAKHRIGFHE
jgi:hypothetical protein